MFLWNINEHLITPESFASNMCQELELPKNVETQVVNQMRDQIQSFQELLSTPIPQLAQEKEFHVILELSVSIGDQFYSDKVEWNLLGNQLSPEEFAKGVAEDMGLTREFETAIAFAVHEEIAKTKRDLIENPQQVHQYTETLPFFNLCHQPPQSTGETSTMMELQGLRYDTRKYGDEFRPHLETLSEWEIEKRETEKERNQRRRKRETMRVGGGGGSGFEGRSDREKKKRYDELEGTWRVF
ncbi:unnamed protein product [Ambrosiozyma monospora]|uniref:Unnamed protein product n=1 Tax=Ambrosiozyma monospora TaxID=43982 RepID=A0ACB5U059_AMBMO|nr:unnamed protein product [Ambrosiozyma monospora]